MVFFTPQLFLFFLEPARCVQVHGLLDGVRAPVGRQSAGSRLVARTTAAVASAGCPAVGPSSAVDLLGLLVERLALPEAVHGHEARDLELLPSLLACNVPRTIKKEQTNRTSRVNVGSFS